VERVECVDWSGDGIRSAVGDRGFECLFHLAAYGVVPSDRDAETMVRINAQLPPELVRLCRARNASMVMAGSSAEYLPPKDQKPLTEQDPLEDRKSYGASKAQGSVAACRVASEIDVPLRVLRLFNVYGPGEAEHRLLPSLVSGLAANRRIALSQGLQVRDFVYVGDVVEALLAAAATTQTRAAEIFNVATGQGRSVREFALMTAKLFGGTDDLLGFGDVPMRPDEIQWLVGDGAALRARTGYAPRHDLASGLAASLAAIAGGNTKTRAFQ
jgi:nucleoside-diphosphate-sugar epimerase